MSESFPSTHDPLTEATQLVKNGRLDQAKEVLSRYLMKNPSSEQGWLLMSFVLADAAQQKDCLERVLRINANNTVAQSRLAHLLGKRTEELFQGKGQPPAPPPPKTEAPAPQITPPPPPPVVKEKPAPVEKPVKPLPPLIEFPPSMPLDSAALQAKKSPFRGKWFLIVVVVLIVLILGIIGTVLYIGVIGPAITHLSVTSTPTPQAVVVPSLPPIWTNTLTPTVTPTPEFTATPTVTPTPPPTTTRTSTKPATKKP